LSGRIHAPIALSPEKEHPLDIEQENRWAPEPVLRFQIGSGNILLLPWIKPQTVLPVAQSLYPLCYHNLQTRRNQHFLKTCVHCVFAFFLQMKGFCCEGCDTVDSTEQSKIFLPNFTFKMMPYR
jgi:hypothetical protein